MPLFCSAYYPMGVRELLSNYKCDGLRQPTLFS